MGLTDQGGLRVCRGAGGVSFCQGMKIRSLPQQTLDVQRDHVVAKADVQRLCPRDSWFADDL
jgi:hypothetical protein